MIFSANIINILPLAPWILDAVLGSDEHPSGAYGLIREHGSAVATTQRAKSHKIKAKV